MCYLASRFEVEIRASEATYRLVFGPEVRTAHHDEAITITADTPVTRPIPPPPKHPVPSQPAGRAPIRRR